MSMKPETSFRAKVREDLKSVPLCKPFAIQQMTINGTPDFLLCVGGTFVGLELKSSDLEEPSKLQEFNLKEIDRCGGIGIVACPQNWKLIHARLQKIGRDSVLK